MLIIHVTDSFHPSLGGIEVQVAELAVRQAAGGHEVHVITREPDGVADGTRAPVVVHRLRAAGLGMRRVVDQLEGVLALLRPDVVHAHVSVYSPLAWAAVELAVRRGARAVVSVHSLWGRMGAVVAKLADLKFWVGDRVVVAAVSSVAADHIRRACPSLTPHVAPNGIDVGWWRGHGRVDADEEQVHVVSVGRLTARREPAALLRAVREVAVTAPNIRVTIAGDGPERQNLTKLVGRYRLGSRVTLVGALDRDGVRSLLSTADVFVNPARRDAFGIATLEALAAGVPVVAMGRSGVVDFVRDGTNGQLCATSGTLSRQLGDLVANRPKRLGMARHNAAHPPHAFDWPQVLARWDGLYSTNGPVSPAGSPSSCRGTS